MKCFIKNYKPDDSSRNGSDRRERDRSRDCKSRSRRSHRSRRNEEAHSTESGHRSELGGPTVTFRNIEQFLSDDESFCSMVSRGEVFATEEAKDKLHPMTIITMPNVKGEQVVTTALLDQCCTGKGLISSKQVKALGLRTHPLETEDVKTFNTVAGTFKVKRQVTVERAMLPCLSTSRTFAMP